MIADVVPGQQVVLDVAGLERWSATVHAVVPGRVTIASLVKLPGTASDLVGAPGQVAFVTPRGLLRVSGVVLAADATGLLELAVADDVEVDQRREHVRAPAAIPSLVARPGATLRPLHTYTVDVSGSGLLIGGAGPVEEGDPVQVTLKLPDRPPLQASGVIARRSREGHVALAFDGIAPADRELLVRFVFERQRLERQAAQEGS